MRVRASTVTVLRVFWCEYGSFGLRLSRLSSFAVGTSRVQEYYGIVSRVAAGVKYYFRI